MSEIKFTENYFGFKSNKRLLILHTKHATIYTDTTINSNNTYMQIKQVQRRLILSHINDKPHSYQGNLNRSEILFMLF